MLRGRLSVWIYIGGVFFALALVPCDASAAEAAAEATEWIRPDRIGNLVAVAFFTGVTLFMLMRAHRGKSAYIRPIAGLEAIEAAVGRAAEMGRPINYVPGLNDASDPATAASLAILSKVAYRSARLRTRIYVPNFSPITYPVARGILRDAYAQAGQAESFNPDDAIYFTSRHMTYTMAVVGMMTREKIATNFLIGHFFSESLILAETGAALGAKQIGGCDSVQQLPFFITTCDYTLIGEELFAASAVISEDSLSRATIAAHDIFKLLVISMILIATVLTVADAFGAGAALSIRDALIEILGGGN
jgi:hypothetical protein